MRVCQINIASFRGIRSATLLLPDHAVFIGDNNTGKTTIFEALDLVLGPDRLNRTPPIDEHDFFRGQYVPDTPDAAVNPAAVNAGDAGVPADSTAEVIEMEPPCIEIEVTITALTEEQRDRFGDYIEFWDTATNTLYNDPIPAGG